jgi:hypothetical protein
MCCAHGFAGAARRRRTPVGASSLVCSWQFGFAKCLREGALTSDGQSAALLHLLTAGLINLFQKNFSPKLPILENRLIQHMAL